MLDLKSLVIVLRPFQDISAARSSRGRDPNGEELSVVTTQFGPTTSDRRPVRTTEVSEIPIDSPPKVSFFLDTARFFIPFSLTEHSPGSKVSPPAYVESSAPHAKPSIPRSSSYFSCSTRSRGAPPRNRTWMIFLYATPADSFVPNRSPEALKKVSFSEAGQPPINLEEFYSGMTVLAQLWTTCFSVHAYNSLRGIFLNT